MLVSRRLTWRGLAWVVFRQHRTAITWSGALYAAMAGLLAANGWRMRSSFTGLGLNRCQLPPSTVTCLAAQYQFQEDYLVWTRLLPLLLLVLPALAGTFTGAAVLGRDFEWGTFRFAWTQGCGQRRLVTVKLVLLGGLLLIGSATVTVLTSWWFAPLGKLGAGLLATAQFVPLGPAFSGWTLLAFGLGVALGVMSRRVLTAIGMALGAWTGLAVLTDVWGRYYLYRQPLQYFRPLASSLPRFSVTLTQHAGYRVTAAPSGPVPDGAYVLHTWLEDKDGHPLRGGLNAALAGDAHAGASAAHAGPAGHLPPPLADAVNAGIRVAGSYQPGSRFWLFQWTETTWLAVLSLLLVAGAVMLTRRPHLAGAGLSALGRVSLRWPGRPLPAPGWPERPRLGFSLLAHPRLAITGLCWRGVAWAAWRQHRGALRGLALVYAAAAALLAISGLAIRGTYHQLGLTGCVTNSATPACGVGLTQFQQDFGTWVDVVPILLLVLPGLAGAFAGATVIARDLEQGTFRYAWTQGAGRTRLIAARLAVLAAALLLLGSLTGVLAQWWFASLRILGLQRMLPQYFAMTDPVYPAWTLFIFALAVVLGAVIRRPVIAAAAAVAGYAGLAAAAALLLRYRVYRAPVVVTAALGQTSLSLPNGSIPVATWWTGRGGTIPAAKVDHAISDSGSSLALAHWILSHDARLSVAYQPDSRFWAFQWTETAWLVVLAALLVAVSPGLVALLRRATLRRAAVAWVPLLALVLSAAGYAGTAYGISPGRSVASAPSPSAPPGRSATGPAHGSYLALGDSVTFGYRPGAVTPAADYLDPSDFTGYPEDLGADLKLKVVNAACPGETTSSMINMSGPSNGCEHSDTGGPGFRDFAPLHVSYKGSQLAFAVSYLKQHSGTNLVTIGIGANDMFRCENLGGCTGAAFRDQLTQVGANLGTILGAIRDQARYRGSVILLTYYSLNYADRSSVAQSQELNAVLTRAAAPYAVRIASGFDAFRTASAAYHGDTCAAGLRIKLPAGGCDEHPSALGQQVLAKAIEQVLPHGTASG